MLLSCYSILIHLSHEDTQCPLYPPTTTTPPWITPSSSTRYIYTCYKHLLDTCDPRLLSTSMHRYKTSLVQMYWSTMYSTNVLCLQFMYTPTSSKNVPLIASPRGGGITYLIGLSPMLLPCKSVSHPVVDPPPRVLPIQRFTTHIY